MSRSGRIPIPIPENTEVKVDGGVIFAKGKLGELSFKFENSAKVEVKENTVVVSKGGENQYFAKMWGTVRSRIFNLIEGVSNGYTKELELVGVGYKAAPKGKTLELNLGFSHPVNFEIPDGITIDTPSQTEIVISGIDKQKVGQVAADIRSVRPPEPYKGKGIKYADEQIVKKEAKKK